MSAFAKVTLVVAGALVAMVLATPPAVAQDGVALQRQAQEWLMAERAARADAMRKLGERIQGIQIDSSTTVRDFVTENDQIQTAFQGFLRGAKTVGEARRYADGSVEVDMEITLEELVTNLQQWHNEYYRGDRVRINDIQQITTRVETKVIRETGSGAVRGEAVGEEPGVGANPVRGSDIPELWTSTVTPQGRLMAARAARADALRKLAERIKGVQINSTTTVQDFVTESDAIDTITRAILVGAKETGTRYHPDELIVDVTMQVTLREVYVQLRTYHERNYRGDRVNARDFEEAIRTTQDKVIEETGQGTVPERFIRGGAVREPGRTAAGLQRPTWPPAIRATGQGAIDEDNDNQAQARLMAIRAAELDARRKLAEQVNGLMITSSTSVQDFVAEYDEIRTDMQTYQQGVRIISSQVNDDGTAEVTVELPTDRLWTIVEYWQRERNIQIP